MRDIQVSKCQFEAIKAAASAATLIKRLSEPALRHADILPKLKNH
jgi:hypothetical protein